MKKPITPTLPKAPVTIEPLRVTVNDAAQMLGVGRSRLYQYVREKRLKPVREGGRTFFTMEELRRFVGGQEER